MQRPHFKVPLTSPHGNWGQEVGWIQSPPAQTSGEAMLRNTRILARLAAMVAVMLMLMAAVAVVGIRGMGGVQEGLRTVYVDRVVPLEDIGTIQSDYFKVRIAVMSAVNARDAVV